MAAYASQPVIFNEHLSTHKYLTGLRKKPQPKQTHQLLASVFFGSDVEEYSLPLCASVASFGKSGHIVVEIWDFLGKFPQRALNPENKYWQGYGVASRTIREILD